MEIRLLLPRSYNWAVDGSSGRNNYPKCIQKWFSDNRIKLSTWQSQAPENLWGELKEEGPRTLEDLKKFCIKMWVSHFLCFILQSYQALSEKIH